MRDIEDAAGGDGPCDVCGKDVNDCICPECEVCGCTGDPSCYDDLSRALHARNELERESGRRGHGLVRTQEQIESKASADALREAEERGEAEYADWWDKQKDA
jgi:hypothetical protein